MSRHLSVTQLSLLVGAALFIGALILILVYAVHKHFQQQSENSSFKAKSPRVENDTAFAMAAMQGVITKMKARERELSERLHAAEQRARDSAAFSENIIREMPGGLLVFDREGFLTLANPAVRTMLGLDTWSRRRYPQILGPESSLTTAIRACLEMGGTVSRATLEYLTPRGEIRLLGLSLSSFHGPGGEVDGAVCLLTDLTETRQPGEPVASLESGCKSEEANAETQKADEKRS